MATVPGAVQTATWPEIRAGANAFVNEWRGESRERAEKDSFWNDFFSRIFHVDRRRLGVFEYAARKYSTGNTGFIDLLVPGQMAVEHKARGSDLVRAMEQLVDYMVELKDRDLPHTLVVCDFDRFVVRDLTTSEQIEFRLSDLPAHLERFGFIAGYRQVSPFESEEAANLEATRLLTDLHDKLLASGYTGHQLRVLLVRILYVLFADDTQVWSKNLFQDYLRVKTAEDGSDLGRRLTELFEVLDTPPERRSANLDADLREFAHVNGGLFQETLRAPSCDTSMRDILLRACVFDWNQISPVIFGSLFQNVTEPRDRRVLGAHYTSERDILRTLSPLFLDALRDELVAAKGLSSRGDRLQRLRALRNRLGTITVLDPACGCGNFLMVAYRELRRIELDVLLAIREEESHRPDGRSRGRSGPSPAQTTFDVSLESQVTVDQFHGIEIEEFPARIAETAMHLVDHRSNLELSAAFGDYYVRLPITDTAHITVGNALRTDWNELLPASECTYLVGNPPFSGQYTKSADQTDDLRLVWGDRYNGYLDYVTGWYAKAADYMVGTGIEAALVSTNSICQGEPVAPLWEPLFELGVQIDFAHRTFLWTSEATGTAGVHVVIVGFSLGDTRVRERLLFDYPYGGRGEPTIKRVRRINAYLAEGPNVFVKPRSTALDSTLPDVFYGSKVADGGHLLVSAADFHSFNDDPIARKYLRRFIGARELIHSKDKWCLWMPDADPKDMRESPLLRARVSLVREARLNGKDAEIRAAADRPAEFLRNKQPRTSYLAIPAHVGEMRPYFPVGYFDPDVITGNHNFVATDPDGDLFALLSSRMFVTWMRGTAGRIRADLRFSKTLAWNNFPTPEISATVRRKLIDCSRSVLEARRQFPDRSLSDLYEPLSMPGVLVKAHQELDRVVDRLFAGRKATRDDADRLAVLFDRFASATTSR